MNEDTITFDTPFVAIEYIKLTIPKTLDDEALQIITLQFQGESVSIPKDIPTNTAVALFSKLYSVADELVFEDKEKYILIFDHQSKNVLRPKNVDMKIWDIIKTIEEPDRNTNKTETVTLQVDELWKNSVLSTNNAEDQILIFISHITKKINYTNNISIKGTIPVTTLLPLLVFLRPFSSKIFYNGTQVF